jgi:hypothetical protein
MAEETEQSSGPEEATESQVITLDEVTMERGTVDLYDHDGVISGNVYRGAVLRGNANLAIEGEILGVPETRSVIEVAGDVQVDGSVTGAKITARNVVVSGDLTDCQILAEGYLEVHGSMSNCQINVGSRASLIRGMNHKRLEARSFDQKISELTVQTSSAARKFIRGYHQVDLKMGNILVPLKHELRVRLDQFYSAMGTGDAPKIDKALEEFYLRVVVGMLTRNTKVYISRNPSRQKIFLKLIEELRVHIMKIRNLDKFGEQKSASLEASGVLLKQLQDSGLEPYVRVGKMVGDGVAITIVRLKEFQENPSGTIDVDRQMIDGRMIQPEEGEGLTLEVNSPGGVKSIVTPPDGGFVNGTFSAWEDDLIWQTT